MHLENGYHLTYCTNIHPGETWEEVLHNLKTYLPPLKQQLSPQQPFGIGLRLSCQAARELLQEQALPAFAQWLQDQELYVFTLNGFPYGNFHHQEVKDQVHQPDWTTSERLDYTLDLARVLARLLPEGMEGGISTSPLSYKPWLQDQDESKVKAVYTSATENLVQLAADLLQLKKETGKIIHIDLEPEPDGLLENTAEVIDYYQQWLLPLGKERLQTQLGLSRKEAQEALLQHLQICYDVCHFALAYERPAQAFSQLKQAGIRIGKIQLSAALKTTLSQDVETRGEIAETLASLAESTYLHQVVERGEDGRLAHYPDLTFALQHIRKPGAIEWRTHFHVPLFTKQYNQLQSTQEDILEVLELMAQEQITQHLEVETYTWEVLPGELKKDLADSIRRELEWVLTTIKSAADAENGSTQHRRPHRLTPR